MRSPQNCGAISRRIAESLDVLGILAGVLAENTIARENCEEGEEPINSRGEHGIQCAIRLIAHSARADFCQMAADLGVPE